MPCVFCRAVKEKTGRNQLCSRCPETQEQVEPRTNDYYEFESETGKKRKSIYGGFVE